MSAPVLTLSSASSPSSSNPYLTSTSSTSTSADPTHHHPVNALATLSRNASVISSSSSSSSSSSIIAPVRPRPLRTFSNHSAGTARARSPNNGNPRSPTTPTRGIPAAYLPRSLSPDSRLGAMSGPPTPVGSRPASRMASRPPNNRSRSNSSVQKTISADDFEFGDILGSGSYSSVISAINRNNGQTYAIKIIDKAHIIRHRKVKYANIEKECLARLGSGKVKGNSNPKSPERNHQRKPSGLGIGGHPGVIKMHWAFHDESSLYFVLDLAPNGELLTHIRRLGSFSYALTKYYTAQLVDTLEYIHSMNIIHRDVKPENILLDAERRIKITDFGTAKILDNEKPAADNEGQPVDQEQRANSFVGSGLYVSPELLTRSYAGKSADVWALGSIIYYMIAGDAPFKSMSEYLTFEKIKKCDYSFPPDDSPFAFSPQAKDVIGNIFILDPASRLTLQDIRQHPFLSSVNFLTLWSDPAPPLEPGSRQNAAPPLEITGFDYEDEEAEDLWNQFVAGHERQDLDDSGPLSCHPGTSSTSTNDDDDPELQRVIKLYGKGKAVEAPDERSAPPVSKPIEVEERDRLEVLPTTHHRLPSVAEEEATPRPALTEVITPPNNNSGFVVVSRGQHAQNTIAPSTSNTIPIPMLKPLPPIDAFNQEERGLPPGPGSACSGTSSEGSPVEISGARRGSSSSNVNASGPSSDGLGLSVWSNAARRASFGNSNGKRLSPDLKSGGGGGGDGGGRRRLSNNSVHAQGGSTRSSSNSRKGSRSGSVFGIARGEMDKWSSIFLSGEQVLFHSTVHSRTRHGLLPAKKRVLVLTDLPRLLCIKDYSDPSQASVPGTPSEGLATNQMQGTGDVAVKNEMLFSAATSTSRPAILSKISEGETSGLPNSNNDGRDEIIPKPERTTGTSSRRSSAIGGSGRPSLNIIKSAETKGEKAFVVRTSFKAYTYIAGDPRTASQWVKEIEDVRAGMQNDVSGATIPSGS